MRRLYTATVFTAAIIAMTKASAAEIPLAGCYERVYDAAHLAKHKSQIVTHATLLVKATDTPTKNPNGDIIADADLRMRANRHKERFDTMGACSRTGDGLSCGGSVSAAETDACKTKTTGVRDCRVDLGEAGGFEITSRPEGVLVTVKDRLELVPAPYDSGPFLNLSGKDAENRSFLLKPAAAETCK
jgi:hypothetical protein